MSSWPSSIYKGPSDPSAENLWENSGHIRFKRAQSLEKKCKFKHLLFQMFTDAIKAAVAYKNDSTDFMDEIMRELEVSFTD